MEYVPKLILLIVLLVLSAFFSGAEASIFSLSKLEKKRMSTRHPRTSKKILYLLEHPRRTLITILISNMTVNTMASTLVTSLAVDWIGPSGVGWTIAIFTLVLVVIGELTPKVFAIQHNESVAFLSALPLDIFARILYPIRRLVRHASDGILSLLLKGHDADPDLVSESELKALARIGEEEGALKSEEGEMIQNLIDLGDRMVREIMTPRTDMIAFDLEEGRDKLIGLIKQYHFSHFPVYEKSLDNLLGVISTQDFMLDNENRLRELIQPPYYVPETKLIDELLHEFQKKKTHVAICVDEYGGTAGLATHEDILEEIFGEFYDEYAKADPLIKTLDDGIYLVQGKIGLHQLEESFGIQLKSETSETLSGWLLEQLGTIPKQHDSYHWEGIDFYIREVHKQRILKVEIKKR